MDKDLSLQYKAIGLNISYYRKLRNMTQMQLADKLDISRTHISNIEAPNMHTSISLDLLLTIALELDIPAYKLLVVPSDIEL